MSNFSIGDVVEFLYDEPEIFSKGGKGVVVQRTTQPKFNIKVKSSEIRGHGENEDEWFFNIDDLKLIRSRRTIKIKYLNDTIERIQKIDNGDWIDLRAAETVHIEKDSFKLIPLGVAMELPEGYEAIVAPRSSTFKNFGIIETNSIGVIDESYKGDSDFWFFPAYALRDTVIEKNERICQFRIQKKMPEINFEEVEFLGNQDRGGHGSTGTK